MCLICKIIFPLQKAIDNFFFSDSWFEIWYNFNMEPPILPELKLNVWSKGTGQCHHFISKRKAYHLFSELLIIHHHLKF